MSLSSVHMRPVWPFPLETINQLFNSGDNIGPWTASLSSVHICPVSQFPLKPLINYLAMEYRDQFNAVKLAGLKHGKSSRCLHLYYYTILIASL